MCNITNSIEDNLITLQRVYPDGLAAIIHVKKRYIYSTLFRFHRKRDFCYKLPKKDKDHCMLVLKKYEIALLSKNLNVPFLL